MNPMSDPASIEQLIEKWRDPEFWKEQGCRMDSIDCAMELESSRDAALAREEAAMKIAVTAANDLMELKLALRQIAQEMRQTRLKIADEWASRLDAFHGNTP